MNKKADVKQIISAVVAAAVLVMVAVLIYWFFSSGYAPNFLKNLPFMTETKEKVIGTEVLGYSMAMGNVQYYDGNAWQDFPKQGFIQLDDKVVSLSSASSSFFEALISGPSFFADLTKVDKNVFKLPSNINDFVFCYVKVADKVSRSFPWITSGGYDLDISGPRACDLINSHQSEQFNVGDIIISYGGKDYLLAMLDNMVSELAFKIKSGKKIYTSKVAVGGTIADTIRGVAVPLRDYGLSRPVRFSYKVNDVEASNYYCIRKMGDLLVVRLDMPATGADVDCSKVNVIL
jgi:hypothetical protein